MKCKSFSYLCNLRPGRSGPIQTFYNIMAKAVEEKNGAEVNAAKLKALQATIDMIEKD